VVKLFVTAVLQKEHC